MRRPPDRHRAPPRRPPRRRRPRPHLPVWTRDDFFEAQTSGRGCIVITDTVQGRTAHPVSCPTVALEYFVEKVIVNQRKNGRYYWAESLSEVRRELDAQPCHCS